MWGKDNYILPGNGYSCHGIHSLHSFPPLAVRRIVTLLQRLNGVQFLFSPLWLTSQYFPVIYFISDLTRPRHFWWIMATPSQLGLLDIWLNSTQSQYSTWVNYFYLNFQPTAIYSVLKKNLPFFSYRQSQKSTFHFLQYFHCILVIQYK